jgi:POT family proton-dependent oligopeptide transporter
MACYGKKKIEPNTVIKFGIGFLFFSSSFYVSLLGFADTEGLTSLNVLRVFSDYLGELSLSPIGLSIMTKLSPKDYLG